MIKQALSTFFIKRLKLERFFAGEGPQRAPVTLNRHRIFILPTRSGFTFALILFAMLMGAINYSLSLGFLLTFLLGGVGMAAMLHTYRNMSGLTFRAGRAGPVFARQPASFGFYIDNTDPLARFALSLQLDGEPPVIVDADPASSTEVTLSKLAQQRGLMAMGRITISTLFPLGLFRAWSYVDLDMHCLVYPAPAPKEPLPPPTHGEYASRTESGQGSEDFSGFRPYAPGDSLRHVYWKALAREQGMLTKQFSGDGNSAYWFDWGRMTERDQEFRLSRLCRWILDAHAAACAYGLRLPGKELPPALDENHHQRCLSALALYGQATS